MVDGAGRCNTGWYGERIGLGPPVCVLARGTWSATRMPCRIQVPVDRRPASSVIQLPVTALPSAARRDTKHLRKHPQFLALSSIVNPLPAVTLLFSHSPFSLPFSFLYSFFGTPSYNRSLSPFFITSLFALFASIPGGQGSLPDKGSLSRKAAALPQTVCVTVAKSFGVGLSSVLCVSFDIRIPSRSTNHIGSFVRATDSILPTQAAIHPPLASANQPSSPTPVRLPTALSTTHMRAICENRDSWGMHGA